MNPKNYQYSIYAPIAAAEVVKNINQPGKWWAKSTTGSAEKVGDKFTVHFGDTFVDFEITQVVPNKKIVWGITDCYLHWLKDKKEWMGTHIDWELSEKDGHTTIQFTHVGLTPGIECYEDCKKGWTGYLKDSLPKLIKTGVGQPD